MSARASSASARPSALERFWSHPLHSWAALPCRLYIGVVFILAAWHKIVHPGDFAVSIHFYGMATLEQLHLFALVLPWLELITGVTVIIGLWTRASALCIAGMTVMFIVALIVAIDKGVQMTGCGCFAAGAEEAMKSITWSYVYRDVRYLAALLFVALTDNGWLGLDGLIRHLRRKKDA